MKTLYLIITCSLLLFSAKQQDHIFRIQLGKSPSCNGFNFCSMGLSNEEAKKEGEVLAHIRIVDEKHIEFSFLKGSINDRTFLKYFSTGTFLLDADYVLDEHMCALLKTERCRLKQGLYDIEVNYGSYIVIIPY